MRTLKITGSSASAISRFIIILLMTLPALTSHAEDLRRYEKTYDCGFVKLLAGGAKCAKEGCFDGESDIVYEHWKYVLNGKSLALPSLSKQLPQGPSILREPLEADRVFHISAVKCQANRHLTVLYTSMGNCRGCEITVSYSLSAGRLFPRLPNSRGSWRDIPFVKEYAFDDQKDITQWLDPEPVSHAERP